MSTLSQAPLIEAIFEIRWGRVKDKSPTLIAFEFSEADRVFFIGRFHGVAKDRGYTTVEAINPGLGGVPHIVTHRFRKAPNTWPCYQVGVGVMTANQVNEGYTWPTFKAVILDGISMLDSAHPDGIAGLPPIGMELKYQDGFVLNPGEEPTGFLREKLNFNFSVPPDLLSDNRVAIPSPKATTLGFELALEDPKGSLSVAINSALINGKNGLVMETTVRTADALFNTYDRSSIDNWLERVHDVQKMAFKAFINPAYMKSLQ